MTTLLPLTRHLLRRSFVSLIFCVQAIAQTTADQPSGAGATSQVKYQTIEWIDLMPEDDLAALSNPPDYVLEVEDGSPEDQISSQMRNALAAASDDRYQQALVSTSIKPEMNGQSVRIPGYIVPLEFSEQMSVTEFFVVPFFGACIHVPPPPPNQIIHVKYPKGFQLEQLYDPFWLSGVLKTSLLENDMATAAYAMEVQHFEPYSEE